MILTINGKDSYTDFGQCIASREISVPEKRIIKESVPYRNGDYDFTSANGEATFENRLLTYTFDIIGADMLEVEAQKAKMLDWLMFVEDADIYDGYIDGYHFHGSYESCEWSEEWEQSQLSVTFSVYPYAIANEPVEEVFSYTTSSDKTMMIENIGSHDVIPTITVGRAITISDGTTSYSFEAGTTTAKNFRLKRGVNTFTVGGITATTTITVSYVPEVF